MRHRFYFDLKNGSSFIRDHDGVEANGLEQAMVECQAVIQDFLESGDLSDDEAGWSLIVRDAAGEALATMLLVQPSAMVSAA